jgi:hypothetical protein
MSGSATVVPGAVEAGTGVGAAVATTVTGTGVFVCLVGAGVDVGLGDEHADTLNEKTHSRTISLRSMASFHRLAA